MYKKFKPVTLLYNVSMETGTVIRIGQVNIMESRRVYQCDKCHHHHVVKVTRMSMVVMETYSNIG